MILSPDHPSFIEKCSELGASVQHLLYPKTYSQKGKWLARIKRRLPFNTGTKKVLKKIDLFAPDLIFINQGSVYQLFQEFKPLFNLILSGAYPYRLLTHLGGGYLRSKEANSLVCKLFKDSSINYFVSNATWSYIEKCLQTSLTNSMVIRNPVSIAQPGYIEYPAVEGTINFATVASLSERKGQDLLLEVFASDQWKERDWVWNIYGEGDFEIILKRLITYYNLGEKVILHGQVDDIQKVWKENHVHILPSIHESAPISIVEAMICGRPNIINDLGGPKEFIDEMNGYVSKGSSVFQLSGILETAWLDRNSWKEKGVKASKEAESLLQESNVFIQDFIIEK